MYSGNELREKFLRFFESKGHKRLPSASLVPDDPTVLLNIAGMVPFKPYFLGKAEPPKSRVTTSQKCVRTNDLDNVGRTARHHTFFEMLGNFSFGDYFKKEVIPWAWEFLTQELKLDPERLWVSVYEEDDEAFEIWHKDVGLPQERIKRMGKDDNFWEMGATGPCGPCSEIYYDFGPERGCQKPDCGVGCDCDRYMEVWNLVFMEFNRDETGKLTPLPQKNIDTGMGLERIASVMQQTKSNFDTDLLRPIISHMENITGKCYGKNERDNMAFRVIADHIRAIIFLIADGVLPANEGRGYVLRRIMRRAVRFGKLLGYEGIFLPQTAKVAISLVKDAYPDLAEKEAFIERVIRTEEERFQETLEQGMNLLNSLVQSLKARGEKTIGGADVFKLYDTYGFPMELTKELAEEEGMQIDEEGFRQAMDEQRERARSARNENEDKNIRHNLLALLDKTVPQTHFVGKETLNTTGTLLALVKDEALVEQAEIGAKVVAIVDRTPFYAEGGGQIGDSGVIENSDGKIIIEDTKKLPGEKYAHFGRIESGIMRTGTQVVLQVDKERRQEIAISHTATHLLHRALQKVLGEHVKQAGSLVSQGRLRFDFSHFSPISSEELQRVEKMVNEIIRANLAVQIKQMSLDEAKAAGAMALFGEKYNESVYVVKIGDFSLELCGGTHAKSTGELGFFKLIGESSVGAGLRRVEAVVGAEAYAYLARQEEILKTIGDMLKVNYNEAVTKIDFLLSQLKEKEREIETLRNKLAAGEVNNLKNNVTEIAGVKVLSAQVTASDMDGLRSMVDMLRDTADVIVLGAVAEGKVNLVAAAAKELLPRGIHAGNLIREVAKITGGGGGGRPDMAQAGGKDPAKLAEALAQVAGLVEKQLNK